jgi:tRNA(fMet)-specific endonuclease VapC
VILLDTDILSLVQRADGTAYERLVEKLDSADENVAVTIVSFEEQMRGWLAFIARARTSSQQVNAYSKLRALLEDFNTRPVVDFDDRSVREFERLARARLRVGMMDLKIAAIAIANDALLLSRNVSDFRRIPGLRIEDWTV